MVCVTLFLIYTHWIWWFDFPDLSRSFRQAAHWSGSAELAKAECFQFTGAVNMKTYLCFESDWIWVKRKKIWHVRNLRERELNFLRHEVFPKLNCPAGTGIGSCCWKWNLATWTCFCISLLLIRQDLEHTVIHSCFVSAAQS